MKKSILKNSVFNIVYKLLNVLFPMITAMYVARILLPEGVGQVGYAQNILSYFTVVASLGIPAYGSREIARLTYDRHKSDKLFSELFIMNLISTILCSIVYIMLIFLIPSFRYQWLLFGAVGIQLFLTVFNVDWFYSGYEEYVYITVRSTVIKIISIICIFIFVKDENSLVIYALISSLAISGNYMCNIVNLRNRVKLCFHELNFSQHLRPVFILLLTTLATDLYNQIDVTMMGSMCSDADIGYYMYAIKLIRILTAVSTAIAVTILPRMSQYYARKEFSEFKALFNKTYKIVMLMIPPCVIGVLLLSENIVLFVYGEKFMPTASIIEMVSPIVFIVAISYLCGSVVLTAVNREKYLLYATTVGMTINIIMNVILIPRYAVLGAAFASVCSECAVLLVHGFFARKYIDLRISKRDCLSVFFALTMLIFVVILCKIFISSNILILFFAIVIGASIYFGILLIMKNSTVNWVIDRLGFRRFYNILVKKL